MKRALVCSLAAALALAACDRGPAGGDEGIALVQVMPDGRTLAVGEALSLESTVRDEAGETPPAGRLADLRWSTSAPSVATVTAAGMVTGVAPGTATIRAELDGVAGQVEVTVAAPPPPCTEAGAVRTLPVGGSFTVDGIAASTLCLDGGAAGSEFVLVPFNGSGANGGFTNVRLDAAGVIPVLPTSPSLQPDAPRAAGPRPDAGFHARLRGRAERELARHVDVALAVRPGGAAVPGPSFALDLRSPTVGQQVRVNVSLTSCGDPDLRTGRVVAVGSRSIVVADVDNPAGGFTDADYAALASGFDTAVHPVVTGAFGQPKDVDGNGRVVLFYTRAVNELTPPGSSQYVGGFFHPRDLFPSRDADGLSACQGTNYAEMFYMLVPDPDGVVNGTRFSRGQVQQSSLGTVAHEYQHLINAARRLYDVGTTHWNEETWLNEALSHVAEEVMFYHASGLQPRQDLTRTQATGSPARSAAFTTFMDQNVARYGTFLRDPAGQSVYDAMAGDDDDLATRGAGWSFLRYAADRRGGPDPQLWDALLASSTTGLVNLQQALGADARQWMRDWMVSVFVDGAVPGPDARLTQPSWRMRTFYAEFPLATRRLPGPGVSDAAVKAGTAAFFRFGVPAAGVATLRLGSAADVPLGSAISVTVVRTR